MFTIVFLLITFIFSKYFKLLKFLVEKKMNPCTIPDIPIDIQGDNRWMSQVKLSI